MAIDPHKHDHSHAHHADVAYEKTDLETRGIWAFFTFLGFSTVVIFLAIAALYKGFGYAETRMAETPNPMAVRQAAPTPGMLQNTAAVDLQKFTSNGTQPLLQTNEPVDVKQFREQEETLLTAPPWKDEKGNIHLPIEQAMLLVAQRNQPVRAQMANPAALDPMMVPSNGGFAGFVAMQKTADLGASSAAEPTIPSPGEAHSAPSTLKVPSATTKVPKQ